MANWNYDKKKAQAADLMPEGAVRVEIVSVEEQTSKKGNEMFKIVLRPSNQTSKLFHYLVFMPEFENMTNKNIKNIYDCFGLDSLEISKWFGAKGAVNVKHEEYNGELQAKVGSFIPLTEQTNLPEFIEKLTAKEQEDTAPF